MILLVDDKPENLFSLRQILELNQFLTDTASSGEEALKKVLKQEYALIILDVQMPGMDGFEVAEAITGLNKTKDIPIIFLSAVNTHKRFITKGFETGAIDYLTKPVDPDILILKVRNFYRLYEKTNALKEAERALTSTVNELHSTLESIPQLAFSASPDGKIEFANSHWLQFAPDRNTFPQTHGNDTPLAELWMDAVQKGQAVERELRLQSVVNGEVRHFLLRATPVKMGDQIVKWVGTFTDIHEQKSLNDLLEQKVAIRTRELLEINRDLEISNHDLQQFASVASHDLKEPLRKIQVFGNLMKDRGSYSDNVAQYIEKILQSSERMSSLITDLLSFARLSQAGFFQRTDLNTIIAGILSDLELLIQEKKAVITVEQLPQLELIPGLARQLFQNIISNALKFSKPGVPPVINIRSVLTSGENGNGMPSEDGIYCQISIEDNGIGFEERYLEKIFTIFQRLNPREQYEGTGIGLAIAKKIVDKHNGNITARSTPGEGSVFVITLPRVQSELQKSRAAEDPTQVPGNNTIS